MKLNICRYLFTYIHSIMHTYLNACLPIYINTFLHIYINILGICCPSRWLAHFSACGFEPPGQHGSCTTSCTPGRENLLPDMLPCFYFSPLWTFLLSYSYRVGCYYAISASRAGILMWLSPIQHQSWRVLDHDKSLWSAL